MVEQIKSENDQNISVDTNGLRKKIYKISFFQTWPNEQCQNLTKKKKTFQFRLGYLLLGFQLKTLEDFFMELFNYLYFTCQKKKNKIKATNTSGSIFTDCQNTIKMSFYNRMHIQ